MPLANFAAYETATQQNRSVNFQLTAAMAVAQRLSALWPSMAVAPATPTTSVALDRNSLECLPFLPSSSTGKLAIVGARINTSGAAGIGLYAIDLLNVSGSLSGSVITEQTTNLPTAALTRHTSGVGVFAGLIIHTAVGTVGTTVTIRYTNQAGTPNQVSTATAFGATGFREARRLIPIPLAPGDTGVRSVEGVTVLADTTTAGNFGVCLFKPISLFSLETTHGDIVLDAVSSGGFINSLAEFSDSACLALAAIGNSTQTIHGALLLSEV